METIIEDETELNFSNLNIDDSKTEINESPVIKMENKDTFQKSLREGKEPSANFNMYSAMNYRDPQMITPFPPYFNQSLPHPAYPQYPATHPTPLSADNAEYWANAHAQAQFHQFQYNQELKDSQWGNFYLNHSCPPDLNYSSSVSQSSVAPKQEPNSTTGEQFNQSYSYLNPRVPPQDRMDTSSVGSSTTRASPDSIKKESLDRPDSTKSPLDWSRTTDIQRNSLVRATDYAGVIPSKEGKTRTKDKYRVVYSDHQRLELEKEFHFNKYITIKRKSDMAIQLMLSERQVKIWFQDRRAKERKQQKKKDEMDKIKPQTQLPMDQYDHVRPLPLTNSQPTLNAFAGLNMNQHMNLPNPHMHQSLHNMPPATPLITNHMSANPHYPPPSHQSHMTLSHMPSPHEPSTPQQLHHTNRSPMHSLSPTGNNTAANPPNPRPSPSGHLSYQL